MNLHKLTYLGCGENVHLTSDILKYTPKLKHLDIGYNEMFDIMEINKLKYLEMLSCPIIIENEICINNEYLSILNNLRPDVRLDLY